MDLNARPHQDRVTDVGERANADGVGLSGRLEVPKDFRESVMDIFDLDDRNVFGSERLRTNNGAGPAFGQGSAVIRRVDECDFSRLGINNRRCSINTQIRLDALRANQLPTHKRRQIG